MTRHIGKRIWLAGAVQLAPPRECCVSILLVSLAVTLFGIAAYAQSASGDNLLPNPSFESVEPPPPTPETARAGAPPDQWLPRTWEVWAPAGALFRCPDDPAQAHSGRRCASIKTPGPGVVLRYGPLPIADTNLWAVRLWARGTGTLALAAMNFEQNRQLNRVTAPLSNAWTEVTLEFAPTEPYGKWWLDVSHEGAAEFWVDDASVSHPGLKPFGLPPEQPLGQDAHTLLYLPCEELREEQREGDVRFLKLDGVELLSVGHVEQSKAGEGRFGKAMGLWPGSSLLCSANQYLNSTSGTVEVWIKLRTPRNDTISQHFVGVPGPDGMYFGKHVWGNLSLGFGSGWRGLCSATAGANAANLWQPGVWRHFAACWDQEALAIFVDGQLVAWQAKPQLALSLGDALTIGGSNWSVDRGSFDFDDLRISDIARYKVPLPAPGEKP